MDPKLQFVVPTPELLDQLGPIAAQTFDFPVDQFAAFSERVGVENLRVATDGNRVVGGMAAYQLGQWFGGRCIPMAGIALVCVPPEIRASGISQFMLTECLRHHRQHQVPLATLYATTQRPYRKVGFEQAGNWCRWELPMTQIGHHEQLRPVHKVECLEADRFAEVAEHRARISNGNLQRSEGAWERLFDARNSPTRVYGYVVGELEAPEGYLIHEQTSQSTGDPVFLVRDMAAKTVEAAHSLWALINGHRTIFPNVQWYGAMHDAFVMTTAEFQPEVVHLEHWMLRIIDVELALRLRGYPPGLNLRIDMEIRDDVIPENNLRCRLLIADGKGTIESGGEASLQLDIRGLAPLYTGFCDANMLHATGLLSGPEAAIETANLIFSGPESWMPDKF